MNKHYYEQIKIGMELIKKGCTMLNECEDCPFDYICDCLLQAKEDGFYIDVPTYWELESDSIRKD